ncbi:hypothetical protein EA007_05805 [Vibrio anguillarum]|nr:hypothetical protein [Vibrio anguillarum]
MNSTEAACKSESLIKQYVDSMGCKTPDDVRKVLEMLISKSARAVEKYTDNEAAIGVIERTRKQIESKPIPNIVH